MWLARSTAVVAALTLVGVGCRARGGDPGPLLEGDGGSGWSAAGPFIDVHLHCQGPSDATCGGAPCCDVSAWRQAAGPGAVGVFLSTQHFYAAARALDGGPSFGYLGQRNALSQASAAAAGGPFFPSLECWHQLPSERAPLSFSQQCRAEVDRWLDAGVRGFKDHAGTSLGMVAPWNVLNGDCREAEPRACLSRSGGPTWPMLDDGYRELVKHIVEARAAVLVLHAVDAYITDPCFSPKQQQTASCEQVSRENLVEFGRWAQSSLTSAARRRIIFPHTANLSPTELEHLLGAGFSIDTSARLREISAEGCAYRAVFGRFPGQVLFGTDTYLGEGRTRCRPYAAWRHLLTGEGPAQFDGFCENGEEPERVAIVGMELGRPQSSSCEAAVPPDLVDRITRLNFVELTGLSP